MEGRLCAFDVEVCNIQIFPKNPHPKLQIVWSKLKLIVSRKEWKDCERMDCITAFKLLGNMKRCSFQGQFFFVCCEEIWGLKEWEML